MPSIKIPIITNELYHVYNRGVDKRIVYQDKHDYLRFYQSLHFFNSVEPVINLRMAKSQNVKNKQKIVKIQAYSLLPNHYHLIISQLADGGLGEFMRRISTGYTSYFNKKNERTGALFQGTFKRVHIRNQEQYQYLFAYVNENQFVHNFEGEREIYASSSIHYQGIRKSKLISEVSKGCYPLLENIDLAREIASKRSEALKTLFE